MAQTNVLVVEDESIVSKDIQHSLKKLGYHVVGAASTGEQAVALAKAVSFTHLRAHETVLDILCHFSP